MEPRLSRFKNGKVYVEGSLFVVACFDNNNICQAVAYITVNHQIDDATVKRLDQENLVGCAGPWSEIQLEEPVPGFKYWGSPNSQLFVSAGSFANGAIGYVRSYETLQGAFLMQSVGDILDGKSRTQSTQPPPQSTLL